MRGRRRPAAPHVTGALLPVQTSTHGFYCPGAAHTREHVATDNTPTPVPIQCHCIRHAISSGHYTPGVTQQTPTPQRPTAQLCHAVEACDAHKHTGAAVCLWPYTNQMHPNTHMRTGTQGRSLCYQCACFPRQGKLRPSHKAPTWCDERRAFCRPTACHFGNLS